MRSLRANSSCHTRFASSFCWRRGSFWQHLAPVKLGAARMLLTCALQRRIYARFSRLSVFHERLSPKRWRLCSVTLLSAAQWQWVASSKQWYVMRVSLHLHQLLAKHTGLGGLGARPQRAPSAAVRNVSARFSHFHWACRRHQRHRVLDELDHSALLPHAKRQHRRNVS